ncbi:MAG: polysaccharide pyruvyl transferase family protein [Acidobacteriia bacterium]|nr:polysaccharide pyruvyl transferase family protein [Terriglobia bacterium]
MHRWPGARIFILDYAKAPRKYNVRLGPHSVDVPLVNMRFSKSVYLRNHVLMLIALAILCRFVPLKALRAWVIRGNACLRAINEASAVASVAGGDSFSDIYGLAAFFYVTLPQLLCLILGKGLLLLPPTYGPFRNPLARRTAGWVLRRAELICSRDYRGVQYAAELAGPARSRAIPRFCPDLGLLLDPCAPPDPGVVGLGLRAPGSQLIGLNVSGLLSKTGGKFGVRAGFKADYDSLVFRLIDFLILSKNASVLLIPHVFGAAEESDSVVCERIYRELQPKYPGRLGLAKGKYDQSEVKYVIGSCDFFIGSRMHACIAAVSQAVPAVSLAYSGKFIGVMETLGLGQLVADLRTMTEAEVMEFVDSALGSAAACRAWLQDEMPKTESLVLDLFAGINELASPVRVLPSPLTSELPAPGPSDA